MELLGGLKVKLKFSIVVLVIIIVMNLSAESENIGTTGFNFFKVQYSARANSMGNSFMGLSNTADALFYNPAGIQKIENKQVSSTFMNYFDGFKGGSFAYVHPFKEDIHLGAFCSYLGNNDIKETVVASDGSYGSQAGTFGASDIIVGLSASKYANEILDIGINVKFLLENLHDTSASAIAVDLAIMHQTTNPKLKLGAAVKNLGKQLTYYTDAKYDEKLPLEYVAGFSYQFNQKLIANADIYRPNTADFSGRLGFEGKVHKNLAIRFGYKTNADDWKTDGDYGKFGGLSSGLGINWRNLVIDYSISSFGDLGFVNQISLSYKL